MKTYRIYSTSNPNGIEGRKRCFFDELIQDFKHIYDIDYLVEFFEKKAQEYFNLIIDEDEKFFEKRRQNEEIEYVVDHSKEEKYLKVTKILRIIKQLQYFYNRGYDFKMISISTRQNGWIMEFAFDLNNLTQEQLKIFVSNAFEDKM